MQIEPVPEHDSSWRSPWPRFYHYRLEHPAQSRTSLIDDVADADVFEVIDRAREQAGADGLLTVAPVVTTVPRASRGGWCGWSATTSPTPVVRC